MHLPKNFKPPGVSDRLRFQSTAQMAMADTGSKYGTLESSAERHRKLLERKIGNTKTSIHFGSDALGYETTAYENDNYNRNSVSIAAGGEGGEAMTPNEMKLKGQKVNWDFGDAPERSWGQASTLNDPTGPIFSSYRGAYVYFCCWLISVLGESLESFSSTHSSSSFCFNVCVSQEF